MMITLHRLPLYYIVKRKSEQKEIKTMYSEGLLREGGELRMSPHTPTRPSTNLAVNKQ